MTQVWKGMFASIGMLENIDEAFDRKIRRFDDAQWNTFSEKMYNSFVKEREIGSNDIEEEDIEVNLCDLLEDTKETVYEGRDYYSAEEMLEMIEENAENMNDKERVTYYDMLQGRIERKAD